MKHGGLLATQAAHGFRPAPACENLYFPGPTGSVFVTPHIATHVRLPFYGMIVISTEGPPIEIRQRTHTARHRAMAFCGKDAVFNATTGYVCVSVNPLHRDFRAFTLIPYPQVLPLDHSRFAAFEKLLTQARDGSLTHAGAIALFDGILAAARPALPAVAPLDERAQALMRMLWIDPRCSIAKLADHLGLSYHRTSHLFSEAVGLPVRKYQLWQKLYRAGGPLGDGVSFAEVAHAAGFVDSAHFSRSFQTAYGRSPSEMFRTRRIKVFAPEFFRDPIPTCLAEPAPHAAGPRRAAAR